MFINGFDILWDEIDDYVADIKSIRSIDQFMFTKLQLMAISVRL